MVPFNYLINTFSVHIFIFINIPLVSYLNWEVWNYSVSRFLIYFLFIVYTPIKTKFLLSFMLILVFAGNHKKSKLKNRAAAKH